MTEERLKYRSAFDIIGPIMIGPSSSHTAGAVKIGEDARKLFGEQPKKINVTFFGSFAQTYKGHGTAVAIIAGVLGFETHDERIPDSIQIAEEMGISVEFSVSDLSVEHPNTATLDLIKDDKKMMLTGVSIGGGTIQLQSINGKNLQYNAAQESGLVLAVNKKDDLVIAELNRELENAAIDFLQQLGDIEICFVKTTSEVSTQLLERLNKLSGVSEALSVIS